MNSCSKYLRIGLFGTDVKIGSSQDINPFTGQIWQSLNFLHILLNFIIQLYLKITQLNPTILSLKVELFYIIQIITGFYPAFAYSWEKIALLHDRFIQSSLSLLPLFFMKRLLLYVSMGGLLLLLFFMGGLLFLFFERDLFSLFLLKRFFPEFNLLQWFSEIPFDGWELFDFLLGHGE